MSKQKQNFIFFKNFLLYQFKIISIFLSNFLIIFNIMRFVIYLK